MKLSEFYRLAVESGMEQDIRGKNALKKHLPYPFADTRILHGSPEIEVSRIMIGIDIEAPEMIVADRLRQQGALDLVVAHHPEGKAWAVFYEVMRLQIDMLARLGVDRQEAGMMLEDRMAEVMRRVLPQNHSRTVDIARLLDIPLMCMHTVADNFAFRFFENFIQKNRPKTAGDIVRLLRDVPEYAIATGENNAPRIIAGSAKAAVGKVYIEMTGGTEGPKKVYPKLYKRGVRTIVCMHLSDEHLREVNDASMNVVVAGHIASDNLGLNLLLDTIERKADEELHIINCSGFRRVKR